MIGKKPPWHSRKFWVSLITTVAMLVSWWAGVDIDVEHLLSIVLPVIAYIFGESWTDARAIESGRHEVQR